MSALGIGDVGFCYVDECVIWVERKRRVRNEWGINVCSIGNWNSFWKLWVFG